MILLVEMEFTDEHTILNAQTKERIGGSMTLDDSQIIPSIAASLFAPEKNIRYVCDQLCYEVWEVDNVIGAPCPRCKANVDQPRDGSTGELMVYDEKTGAPRNWCHICDTNLIWEADKWKTYNAD